MLKLKDLKELLELDYNIPQGLRWKIKAANRLKIGSPAGTLQRIGYFTTGLYNKRYYNHRLVYAITHNLELNQLPKHIDHIDRNKTNNNPSNLREATISQNIANTGVFKNNTCGLKGTRFHKQNKKWQAQITFQGKRYHLGYYSTKEEAHEVYKDTAYLYFGEFANNT